MKTLDALRDRVAPWIIGSIWLIFALIVLRNLLRADGPDPVALIAGLAASGAASLTWWQNGSRAATRAVSSLASAASIAILVYSFNGSELQIDVHMCFFAGLAICGAWIDWRALVANAALVAVHHLVFTYAIPYAVFPGEADLARVMLHAAVLVAQCAALIALSIAMTRAFEQADRSVSQATEAERQTAAMAENARLANGMAERERQTREAARDAAEQAIGLAVGALRGALSALAQGDMTARIDAPLEGDLNELRVAFNQSADQLEKVLVQVSDVARSIRHGSAQIHQANEDLAKRSERQAHSIAEATADLQGITETVRITASLADKVGSMVQKAQASAEGSSTIVNETVEAMRRIETSSSEIGQIIGVIDEIAFQTNLLALNAGVEAARAGEAGKGFAVVAQEVRELAQRSAKAAKEIKALVSASSGHVDSGVALVARTGEALRTIAAEVSQISSDVRSIVERSREQSGRLSGIGTSMADVDINTQQTAAMVEESSAAIGSVASEANELDRMIRQFRITEGAARRRAA